LRQLANDSIGVPLGKQQNDGLCAIRMAEESQLTNLLHANPRLRGSTIIRTPDAIYVLVRSADHNSSGFRANEVSWLAEGDLLLIYDWSDPESIQIEGGPPASLSFSEIDWRWDLPAWFCVEAEQATEDY